MFTIIAPEDVKFHLAARYLPAAVLKIRIQWDLGAI